VIGSVFVQVRLDRLVPGETLMYPRHSEPLERRVLLVAGDLDLGFGVNGIATADLGNASVIGIDVATFGDRIYAAGIHATPGSTDQRIALAAFDPSGRPDPSLGGDGTVVTGVVPAVGDFVQGEMALQPDGKILVLTGLRYNGPGVAPEYTLARFNPDGSTDTTFGGGDGHVGLDRGEALALAPGGKIVVSGNAGGFGVVRLNPDGTFDTTFDGDGHRELNFGYGNDSGQNGAEGVAVLPDGRIVLVGAERSDFFGTPDDFDGWYAAAARLNPDGSNDLTFGDNGLAMWGYGYFDNGLSAVTSGPNGEVVAAAMVGEIKARPDVLTGSAVLPASNLFGSVNSGYATIHRIHVMPDGKVVVSGELDTTWWEDGGQSNFLARYNTDGTFDATFAGGRVARVPTDRTALTPEGDVITLVSPWYQHVGTFGVARYLGHDVDNRTTVIPAEAPLSFSGAVVSRTNAGFTGGGYIDFVKDSGATAAYELYVRHSGTYELRIRYANGTRRARVIDVGGTRVAFLPTGSWTRWREARVRIQVAVRDPQISERRVIELRTIGRNGPNIDTITVVRPDLPVTLQAEDATLVGASALSQNRGYDGRGYADYVDPDSYVEWEFDSPVRQTLALSIRYANGTATARPLKPILNGNPTGYFAFRPTGSWSTWRTETIYLEVAAGMNRLRLAAGADGAGPNLDWLRVG
jgi:uncharacterized delta-60 repeat protein